MGMLGFGKRRTAARDDEMTRTGTTRTDSAHDDTRNGDDAYGGGAYGGGPDGTTVPTQRMPADQVPPSAADVDARRQARFGGAKLGAAFFGWLVAVGLTVLLSAIVGGIAAAAGAAVEPGGVAATGLTSAIVALAVLLVAYYAGGYVAGRLARFDGGRNGFLSWAIGLLVTVAAAAAAAIVGGATDVFRGVRLPAAPLTGEQLTLVGVLALAVTVLGTLLAAVLGGKAGERFHRKVDRFG